MSEPIWIRQSEMTAFKDCRRRTAWSYWQGLTPIQKVVGTADTGTIVHAGLEAHYRGGDALAAISAYQQADQYAAALADNYVLARIMVRGYLDWLEETGADAGTTTVAVEQELEVLWGTVRGHEVWLTGKVDREYRDMFDDLWLQDHKTVAQISTEPIALMDEQRMAYAVMKKMVDGTSYKGGEHNQLRRVKRTAQSKPPYYGRSRIVYNAEQLNNHWKHMAGTIDEIVRTKLSLAAGGDEQVLLPPRPSNDCSWKCAHRHLCSLRDDGSDWQGYISENYLEMPPVRGRVEGQ